MRNSFCNANTVAEKNTTQSFSIHPVMAVRVAGGDGSLNSTFLHSCKVVRASSAKVPSLYSSAPTQRGILHSCGQLCWKPQASKEKSSFVNWRYASLAINNYCPVAIRCDGSPERNFFSDRIEEYSGTCREFRYFNGASFCSLQTAETAQTQPKFLR